MVRVLLIDTELMTYSNIKNLLLTTGLPSIDIVAEAVNGKIGIQLVQEKMPDVVLLDAALNDMNSIEVCRAIKSIGEKIKIIFLLNDTSFSLLKKIMVLPVHGFIAKNFKLSLFEAIQFVKAGNYYCQPDIITKFCQHLILQNSLRELKPRDVEMLRLLAANFPYEDIAKKIHVSVKSISQMKIRAMEKINIKNKKDLSLLFSTN